jgi:hypothetical protein
LRSMLTDADRLWSGKRADPLNVALSLVLGCHVTCIATGP